MPESFSSRLFASVPSPYLASLGPTSDTLHMHSIPNGVLYLNRSGRLDGESVTKEFAHNYERK